MAVGAAIACPDQKVIGLEADGSAMYTVQALWTMVREDLDVTVLILNNGSCAILNIELARVGVEAPGPPPCHCSILPTQRFSGPISPKVWGWPQSASIQLKRWIGDG